MERPGVMIYFEYAKPISRLSEADQALLFRTILQYGMTGQCQELEGIAGAIWDLMKRKMDVDAQKYDDKVLRKRYANYCRHAKDSKVPYEQWLAQQNSAEACISLQEAAPASLCSVTVTEAVTETETVALTETVCSPRPAGAKREPEALPGDRKRKRADKPLPHTPFVPPSQEEVRRYCQEIGYPIEPGKFVDYYAACGWKVGSKPMYDWRAAVRSWRNQDKEKSNGQRNFTEDAAAVYGRIGTRL